MRRWLLNILAALSLLLMLGVVTLWVRSSWRWDLAEYNWITGTTYVNHQFDSTTGFLEWTRSRADARIINVDAVAGWSCHSQGALRSGFLEAEMRAYHPFGGMGFYVAAQVPGVCRISFPHWA